MNFNVSHSYITVTYVIEAMAAANAWKISSDWKAKKKNIQKHRQISDHSLTVCKLVRYSLRLMTHVVMVISHRMKTVKAIQKMFLSF